MNWKKQDPENLPIDEVLAINKYDIIMVGAFSDSNKVEDECGTYLEEVIGYILTSELILLPKE